MASLSCVIISQFTVMLLLIVVTLINATNMKGYL